eukprot:TRINITY_DN28154_c0_g1_i1.p1 TRINITY_DN28154_c0_g1~~TRINITY_DN28154_c0_g1_i1.p1  ORF type:complete len:498 (+),score=98.09 TRINITY_DN28154_c0_g1_i1:107-1600(+)
MPTDGNGNPIVQGNAYSHSVDKDQNLEHSATAFMFLATALVQFMVPGCGLLYSGMVPTVSTIQMIIQCFSLLGLVFFIWMLVAFSMAFGQPWIQVGGYTFLNNPFTYFMLTNVDIHKPLNRAGGVVAQGMPGMLFMAFHGMFAVVTPALITGCWVNRFRFGPYLLFVMIWCFIVYVPLACWNWGGGWMFQIGAWDFAGGMVVHECAGWSALGGLLALGRRADLPSFYPKEQPHSMVLVVAGTALLWFGWFGFNGGSALTIGGLATIAFINTQVCPATAMVTWVLLDWTVKKRPTLLGACCGSLAGLVIITPWSGFAQPWAAMVAGVCGGLWCWSWTWFVHNKTRLDDACDVFSIHGTGGWLGAVMVGIFSDPPECQDRKKHPAWCANPGTCARGWGQIMAQVVAATVCAIWASVGTYLIIKMMHCFGIKKLTSSESQAMTLDFYEFGEVAYRHYEPLGPYTKVPMPEPPPKYYESDEESEFTSDSFDKIQYKVTAHH